ncbi:hypothetical protein ACUTAH_22460 [Metapseudomonas furukawaii]|uniref:hypothetical protein n=1 Tax=Metapseudomonas furukawaii TaxID=1149133 RepID=UPI0040465733
MFSNLYSWIRAVLPLSLKRAIVLILRRLFYSARRESAARLAARKRAALEASLKVRDQTIESRKRVGATRSPVQKDSEKSRGRVFDNAKGRAELVDLEDLPSSAGQNVLLFVEAAAARLHYDYLVRLVVDEGYFIVFRSKKDCLELLSAIGSSGVDESNYFDRVVYIPTIDPSLDESVYTESDELSRRFLELAVSKFSKSDLYSAYSAHIKAMQVGVSDRFVGWVRSYRFLLGFIDEYSIDRFYVFGSRLIDNNIIAFAVGSCKGISCGIVRYWNSRKFRSRRDIDAGSVVSREWVARDRFTTTKYKISESCSLGAETVLFFGNLRDPMYRGTLQPVLDLFSTKTDMGMLVLLPYADDEELDNSSYRYVLPVVERDDMPGMDEFNSLFDSVLDEFIGPVTGLSGGDTVMARYVALNARKSVHRVLRDCFGLMLEIDKVCRKTKISALVSNPGRLWPSQFSVGYLSSVPSFDIQSGTLSRSNRYKRPGSANILAVDDFSRSVYVDFLGVDSSRVEIVGAPRIDARLAAIREYTKQQSREFISVCDTSYKILCLATQPYDIELMVSMVEEAHKFVSGNEGWFLLLSMHPNENDAFKNSYEMLLKSSSCADRVYISQGNIYHNLNASDAVVTYFSTAGLEAFCLDKPVLAFRPESYPKVPFDLCELGVARPFATGADLEFLLGDLGYKGGDSEGLRRLKDGRSVERICDFILSGIAS